jgi:hypothetical protein
MNFTYRPLPVWPHPVTRNRRWRPFKASWSQTMALLDRELHHLAGRNVIIAIGLTERDIRLDGRPRADAKTPAHPGVELSFDSRYGRLTYPTDVCSHWDDNVRSIALGLEALRAVDRYGVSQKGQQYAGWKELPSGIGRGVVIASTDAAWDILDTAAGGLELQGDEARDLEWLYRRAAKRTHPDQGGSDEAFLRVRAAYELLKAAS